MTASLEFGLGWDRDRLLHLASTIRTAFWPISAFLIQPLVIFVLIRKTHMDADCKMAFVAHNTIHIFFDVYMGLFYQLYPLLPYPVFCCTGLLCDENHSPRMLLTILAFLTISMCVPYLFVMMRIHQKMLDLSEGSALKLSKRSQVLLMLVLSTVLISNVYGFGAWSVESPDREAILQIPSIAWARNQSDNFLVLGWQYGDIGLFIRATYLLLFSILVCFSFYVGVTYHAIFVIGKQTFVTLHKSRTYQMQLRFMISMSIQAFFTSIMFITPLAFLFAALVFPLVNVIPASTGGPLRISLVVMYSCCSIGHSSVFLSKSAWCIKHFRRLISRPSTAETTTRVHKLS